MLKSLCRALAPRSSAPVRCVPFAAAALLGLVAVAAPARAQYCAAGSAACTDFNDDERIYRVTFGTIDNNSGFGDGPTGCYTDFTAISTTVVQQQSYTFTLYNVVGYGSDQAAVWIDWNQDQTFDASEKVALTPDTNRLVFSGIVTVPAGALPGTTRLRARLMYSGTVSPCGNASYGEVEDYSVIVLASNQGACCNTATGACSTSTAAACGAAYQGDGTTCSPSNPCGGACCNGASCTVSTAATCPSGSIFVNQRVCGPTACTYCAAGSSACGTANNDERIAHLTFNTIDNDSGTGAGPSGCYSDFTGISTNVYTGQTYTITLTNAGVYSADQAAVWIDFNQDLTFGGAGSGEQFVLTSADGNATFTGSITIPATATLGPTRLRARVMYSGTLAPCGIATYGEVEDYTVTIAVGTNGACCQASGACTETLPGDCAGAFSGVGTSCAPANPCGGACCDSAGTCSVTTAAACPSGSAFTNGGVCSASYCSGACCQTSGACELVAGSASCTGAFSGAHTSCTPSPCPGQSCASPIPVVLDVPTPGDLAASASNSTISCSTGTKGLWYSFTAPATGAYNFSSTQTSGTGNPSLALFSACGTEVACANPCGGTSTSALQTMTAGQQIIFRAGGCADTTLTWNVTVTSAVIGACCDTTTGTCVQSSTGAAGCPAGSTYMNDSSVCSATLCGQGACCDATSGACTLATTSGCTGQFQSVGSSCSPNPCPQPPPPANDLCSAATNLNSIPTFPGTAFHEATNNHFATNDGPSPIAGNCNSAGAQAEGLDNSIWYRFTPATSGTLHIRVAEIDDDFDLLCVLYSGADCSSLVEVADPNCDGDSTTFTPTETSDYFRTLSAGVTYYLGVGDWGVGDGGGTIDVTLEFVPDALPGTCCRGATCSTAYADAAACGAGVASSSTAGPGWVFVAGSSACNTPVTVPGTLGNITTPCCFANYNHNAQLEVQDIFDFLNDWFAGNKMTLVGGDGVSGTLAVQNIFDFLNAWFAGGCN